MPKRGDGVPDQAFLDAIVEHTKDHGYPPSLDELASMVGLASKSTVKVRLARLQREGRITAVAGSPRTLVVVR